MTIRTRVTRHSFMSRIKNTRVKSLRFREIMTANYSNSTGPPRDRRRPWPLFSGIFVNPNGASHRGQPPFTVKWSPSPVYTGGSRRHLSISSLYTCLLYTSDAADDLL